MKGALTMNSRILKQLIRICCTRPAAAWLCGLVLATMAAVPVQAGVEASFLYSLSNFTGPIPFNWATIYVDRERNEIYVTDSRQGDVRIFNDKGMEIYRFGDDGRLGKILGVALDDAGNIFALTRNGAGNALMRCDFRGEPISEIALQNLPDAYAGFEPTHLAYRQDKLYLLDAGNKQIVITDPQGIFLRGYELHALLNVEDKRQGLTDIGGFSLDPDGNILFTIPSLFSAFILSPTGEISGFGRPGSAPGRFGIVGGIVADDKGYYYVADRLRCVVLVFDKDFRFQKEFGYRGYRPENFIGPRDLALDPQGRLYISQINSRGVSVFNLSYGASGY
jgi:DNA-binding beta-propeller fold protein YncE